MTNSDHTRSLAIYCQTLKPNDDPFSSDYYWQAYQDFMLALKSRGTEVFLVTGSDNYLGDGMFREAFKINEKTELENLTRVENIKVNAVFNRAGFMSEDVTVVSSPYIQRIGTDKIEMYKNFARHQPFSIVCENKDQLVTAINEIAGNRIVVKEPVSYGGHHVFIGTKEDALSQENNNYPLLVQEFLDTSMGVPGFAPGVHDIRLSMCGGELIGCYIRQAKEGSLHSNVAQGGKMLFMDINEAPQEAVIIAKDVDKLFNNLPRYYSVDLVNTPKGWKLLEINTLLALIPVTDGPEAIKTLERLADYFAAISYKDASIKGLFNYDQLL